MTAFAHNTELNIAIAGGMLGIALLLPEAHAARESAEYAYGATAVIGTLLSTLGGIFLLVFALDRGFGPLRWLLAAASLALAVGLAFASALCATRVGSELGRLAALLLAALPVAVWIAMLAAFLRNEGGLVRVKTLVDRIDNLAARVDDDAGVRLAKAIALFLGVFVVLGGGVAARVLAARGATRVADWFAVAALLALVALIDFGVRRSLALIVPVLLATLLLLPLAAQLALGGFAASGGMAVWAMLAPLAALALTGPRRSVYWFAAFVVGALWTALEDPQAAGAALWFAEGLLLASCVAFILLRHFVAERARIQTALEREQERSESLLLNILPGPIAERLKQRPGSIADDFAEVTVLFADIVGFTQLSTKLAPGALVALLNDLFSRFDALSAQHGVEKIKTIGDAYMACAGLPIPRADHARVAAELALDMQQALAEFCEARGIDLRIRIGLNTGPVVAGVIGTKKFIYDLWGDTVNTASRMESHGVPGAIQVTEATRHALGAGYEFEDRGEIDVKGKGRIRTALLLGRRAPA